MVGDLQGKCQLKTPLMTRCTDQLFPVTHMQTQREQLPN